MFCCLYERETKTMKQNMMYKINKERERVTMTGKLFEYNFGIFQSCKPWKSSNYFTNRVCRERTR